MAKSTEFTQAEQKEIFKQDMRANEICSIVGRQLVKHYPGWTWYVDCTPGSGVVTVRNLNIHGQYGFVIPIRDLYSDVDLKLVTMAGGELLERCNLPRSRYTMDIKIEKDYNGNAVDMDVSGA